MSSNLQNSIWPNTDGNLGNIKVEIPDGVTTTWPTGDALVHNFVYNKGNLVGFVDTKALIANSSKSTTFPYEYVNISLPSIAEGEMTYNHDQCAYFILNGKVIKGDIPTDDDLEEITKKYAGCTTVGEIKAVDPNYLTNDIVDGVWKEGLGDLISSYSMFANCANLTTFYSNLSSLMNGNRMFYWCTNLTSFTSDLSSLQNGGNMFQYCRNLTSFSSNLRCLTNGNDMFRECTNLASFTSDLSSLTNGEYMFINCTNLTSFNSDSSGSPVNLSSLTNGHCMFHYCEHLASFSSDLRSLKDGRYMFYYTQLNSFSSDLSKLQNGYFMFSDCYYLTSFSSDLRSLTDGFQMFSNCKLDTASVQNIANTINTVSDNPSIHVGVENTDDKQIYFEQMRQKGWDVLVTENGGSCGSCYSSLTTLDETDGEFVAPKPYWAKPVQSDEEYAHYIDSEGNFYNILGGNYIYVHDPEEYGMFTSLEDAQTQMGLKKIGEEEIETA